MLIISVTSKTTRWMCHRARPGCQKKLKFTTNQSEIEQQKAETETCLFSLTVFAVLLFSSWEILNENLNSANSVVNMHVVCVDKHWRRARRHQLVLLLFLSPTRHTRLVGEYLISTNCISLHQAAFTARCHSHAMCEQRNEQKSEEIIEQFNHSNWFYSPLDRPNESTRFQYF